jgi:hypothetical protein
LLKILDEWLLGRERFRQVLVTQMQRIAAKVCERMQFSNQTLIFLRRKCVPTLRRRLSVSGKQFRHGNAALKGSEPMTPILTIHIRIPVSG